MNISLVLASKNEERYAKRFFESLSRQTKKPFEVILVDSSTDRTPEIAQPYVDKLIKVETESGRNSAGHQRNIGVKNSTGDIIVFTDIDTELHPDWLEKLERKFGDPKIYVVQGSVFLNSYDGSSPLDNWIFSTKLADKGKYLNFCNSAFRRNVLEENPLAEDIRWDDAELGYRINKKYPIYGCKEAKVYHYGAATGFKGRGNSSIWLHAMAANIGWIRILKKHPTPYWLARIWYNIATFLFALNLKAFIYFSVAFFYAFYIEVIEKEINLWKATRDYIRIKSGGQ